MYLTHGNEIQKHEFKCDMQNICELFKFWEIHNNLNIDPKIANKISKCSEN